MATTEALSIRVDFCFDGDTVDRDLAKVRRSLRGGTAEVVQEHGPAGGWPVVQLTAPRHTLRRVLRDFWAEDDDSIAELYPDLG